LLLMWVKVSGQSAAEAYGADCVQALESVEAAG
jgi:hypothetical protein